MSEKPPIDKEVSRGIAWTAAASSWVAALDVVVLFIILQPGWVSQEQFGIASLVISLFPILDLMTDLGLSAAVIQRDDHTPAALSTIFWINLGLSLILAAALAFIGAPLLVGLHGYEIIGWMLIAYGGKLIFQNIYFIPQAVLKKELRFKQLAAVRSLANVAEFIGKVGFAAAGFGPWCFVLGRLGHTLVTAIGIQVCRPWLPRLIIDIRKSSEYLKFGLKTSASQILFHAYTNVDYHVVNIYFGAEAAGAYALAYQIVMEPVRMVSFVIYEVAFPAFAKVKAQRARLAEQFVFFTRINLVTVLPVVAFFAISSGDILEIFWPEYSEAADVLRVLCVLGMLRALSYIVPPLLDGSGRPELTLVYSAVATVAVPGLIIVFPQIFGDTMGFMSVAVAWAVGYPIAFAVLVWMGLALLEYPVGRYMGRVIGVIACVAVAGAVTTGVHFALASLPSLARLLAVAAVMLGLVAALLYRFEGLSPSAIKKALRGDSGKSDPRSDTDAESGADTGSEPDTDSDRTR